MTSLEPIPDIEFVVQTGDTGMLAGAPWVLSRKANEESLVLMPGSLLVNSARRFLSRFLDSSGQFGEFRARYSTVSREGCWSRYLECRGAGTGD